MTAFAHNCAACRPKPIVVWASDKADALKMIQRAKRVVVCTKGMAMFAVTKKQAVQEIDRLVDRHMPRVSRLLGSNSVFIE